MTTKTRQPATSCSHPDADEVRALLATTIRRDAASTTQLAQAQEQIRELNADRAAVVELLLATDVEPASDDPVQLAAQVRELVRELRTVARAAADLLDMLDSGTEGETDNPDADSAAEKLWRALRAVGMEEKYG